MVALAPNSPLQSDCPPEEITQLEIAPYVSLAGLAARAANLADRARGAGDRFLADRAKLVESDVLSRTGELQAALELQRGIAERARHDGLYAIVARASAYLSFTCFRFGLAAETQDACGACVALLDEHCPRNWHVEHHMLLACFTGYERAGAGGELLEESLRRAREYGDPNLLIAVLNNMAWVAHQTEATRPRAAQLVDELSAIIGSNLHGVSPSVIDTVAWIRFDQGDTAEASRLFELAIARDDGTEPYGLAALRTHLATVRRRQGRPTEAVALLEHARASAQTLNHPEWGLECLRSLAELDAERADHRRAYRRMVRYVAERARFDHADSDRRAAALQTIHATQLEREQRRYFEDLAIRDPLTGLYNRRYLERELPELLIRGGLVLAMLDIDNFKEINDTFSHDVGDDVLREVARLLVSKAALLSARAFAVRLGGDEFLFVAPGVDVTTARGALNDVRSELALTVWNEKPTALRPTLSVGLATGDGRHDTTRRPVCSRALMTSSIAPSAGGGTALSMRPDDGFAQLGLTASVLPEQQQRRLTTEARLHRNRGRSLVRSSGGTPKLSALATSVA